MNKRDQDILLATYAKYLRMTKVTGSVLEIGCGPSKHTLLASPLLDSADRVGLNLIAYKGFPFEVVKGNSNDMRSEFRDATFDTVISNMVLEHDQFFWKSLQEIRRVLKPGGTFVVGVPGILSSVDRCKRAQKKALYAANQNKIPDTTYTWRVHAAPSDYWRFTEEAYKTVIMEGFTSVKYSTILLPPLIIGSGVLA